MVYDITNPHDVSFVTYINTRDFSVDDPTDPSIGDLGPEIIHFIREDDSPNKKPLLIVSNEISGTTAIFEITKEKDGKGPMVRTIN